MNLAPSRLERAVNLIEIKDLLCRERYYRDTGNWKGLRDAWHPDSSKTNIDISW